MIYGVSDIILKRRGRMELEYGVIGYMAHGLLSTGYGLLSTGY